MNESLTKTPRRFSPGGADEADHLELPVREQIAERAEIRHVAGVRFVQLPIPPPEARDLGVRDLRQAEQLADHSAARVRDEGEQGALGQDPDKLDRVLDRALAQGPMLEGVDVLTEAASQRPPLGSRLRLGESG